MWIRLDRVASLAHSLGRKTKLVANYGCSQSETEASVQCMAAQLGCGGLPGSASCQPYYVLARILIPLPLSHVSNDGRIIEVQTIM